MNSDTSRLPKRLVLVTGPSGSGRSTAINTLEDLEYEAIDNLPLHLVPKLLEDPTPTRPMALGIDPRNRDFSTEGLIDLIDRLTQQYNVDLTTFYLECSDDVLIRRFSETRRRHPLAPAETPAIGIARERALLADIRERADTLIDTTEMNVHQLRAEVERWFAPSAGTGMAVSVQSFSYKRGLPRGIDMVLDCRFLANPYWEAELRALDGRDKRVQDYVRADDRFATFFDRVLDLTRLLLPAYVDEGKSHLSIAFGCTGGQHRSVTLAETLAKALAEDGQRVSIRHRELDSQHKVKRPV